MTLFKKNGKEDVLGLEKYIKGFSKEIDWIIEGIDWGYCCRSIEFRSVIGKRRG